jgi:hypothetical protein
MTTARAGAGLLHSLIARARLLVSVPVLPSGRTGSRHGNGCSTHRGHPTYDENKSEQLESFQQHNPKPHFPGLIPLREERRFVRASRQQLGARLPRNEPGELASWGNSVRGRVGSPRIVRDRASVSCTHTGPGLVEEDRGERTLNEARCVKTSGHGSVYAQQNRIFNSALAQGCRFGCASIEQSPFRSCVPKVKSNPMKKRKKRQGMGPCDKSDRMKCPRCGSTSRAWDGLTNPILWVCGLCRMPLQPSRRVSSS